MKKVVGLGDFLVSLSAPLYQRFIQSQSFNVNYTGAEANVLVSLSYMGIPTEFVTRLPDNDIAKCGIATLRKYGVGTSGIVFGGDRIGALYMEKGASQRPSKVVYDRKYSSVCGMRPEDFDWNTIFDGVERFHITGITPALSKDAAATAITACKEAKERGVAVSCDLNYRKNLWSPAEAKETMEKMLPYIDVVIANEEDADKVLGIHAPGTDVVSGQLNKDGYVSVAKEICERYGIGTVAITLRTSISASDNEWAAMLYEDGKPYFSRSYSLHIVDRVGGGDSFCAGLLYGFMQGFDAQKRVEYATAASCLKHSIEQDFNLSTTSEITKLMEGDASGRVQR